MGYARLKADKDLGPKYKIRGVCKIIDGEGDT